jgi:Helicase conserved C-terminal domain
VEFSERLRSLLRPDLEELLARRPETYALGSRSSVSFGDLAGLLAQPHGIARAIQALDRFHGQVLELACLAGGSLAPAFAEEQGLATGLLPAAAAELARWGLAFPDGGNIWVARSVVAAVPDPGGLGRPLRPLLESLTRADLTAVVRTLGALPVEDRKADLMAAIAGHLGDHDVVRELVAGAPPTAARILAALRAGRGGLAWHELASEVPDVHHERGLWYQPLRPGLDGIAWLRARALVAWIEWDRRLVIPAEVELALRGRVFPSWEPEPPPLELVPLESQRHPADLVIDVDGLLDLWRREPASLLQSGELGVRERRRAAAAVAVPEGSVGFLTSLAMGAGLLGIEQAPPRRPRVRGRPVRRSDQEPASLVVMDDAVRAWRNRDLPERWGALVGPWLRAATQPAEPMRVVLDELAALPEDRGAVVAGLIRRLAWRHPGAFADVEAATDIAGSAVVTLHCLGLGAGPSGPVAGIDALGRAVLRGEGPAQLAARFPAAESTCTVQADLRIIVAGAPEPTLARELARMADLETASVARVYRLSEASLRRALDGGLSALEIAAFLRGRSPSGLPQNVEALIEDVGRRHGRLRVGRAALYLQADDQALLAQVAADRRLRGLRLTLLAPTVAVVQGADEAQVLDALRKAGYMPGVEGQPAPAPPRRDARRHVPPPPRAAPTLTAAQRRELADRLVASPRRAEPAAPADLTEEAVLSGITISGRDEVEKLMRLAVGAQVPVEIEYRNLRSGTVTQRVIEPLLVSDAAVVGHCRLRGDSRTFAFDGVRWARVVDEAAAPADIRPPPGGRAFNGGAPPHPIPPPPGGRASR